MTTPANFIPNPNPDPIAIYLVNAPLPDAPLPDDPLLNDPAAVGAVPISGVVNFGLAVRNPAVDRDISDDTRPPPRPMRGRPATLRAWRRHRQRRLYPHGINLTLDYNPQEPAHRLLLAAGESGAPLTLRIIISDAAGQPAHTQDVDCAVVRCRLDCRPAPWRRMLRPDDYRPYICQAELRLQPQGSPGEPAPITQALAPPPP